MPIRIGCLIGWSVVKCINEWMNGWMDGIIQVICSLIDQGISGCNIIDRGI